MKTGAAAPAERSRAVRPAGCTDADSDRAWEMANRDCGTNRRRADGERHPGWAEYRGEDTGHCLHGKQKDSRQIAEDLRRITNTLLKI